jgi:hypothetical protein
VRVTIDPAFEIVLPSGWSAEPDEEGGISVAGPDGVGLLHLIAFEQPNDEYLDPAEELYTFLEDQGIELEEDEIEDLELPGGADLSLCEYVAEEEEEAEGSDERGETTYWLVGVATIPGSLVFSSYTCPADEMDRERETIREILSTLQLHPPTG